MEAPRFAIERQRRRSRRTWFAVSIVAVLVILAIAVPLAVILPRRIHGLPTAVILPLYSYPLGGAWDPLFHTLDSSHERQYTVVINPNDGPGNISGPGEDYLAAIARLNVYANVRTIGYVRTRYASRNITSVMQDVTTYAHWSTMAANLSMHGIFFDEVPSTYSLDVLQYLNTINDAVKSSEGIASDRLIVHNPGTEPDATLVLNSTDVIVSFEDSYDIYQTKRAILRSLPLDRSRYAFMVHSVPASVGFKSLTSQLSAHAASVFETKLSQDYYESFGPDWSDFCHSVPV
ncbi:hypothetical protein LTR86_000749 [Recurvomyces mirabilis]|nr:hypothetical protein LTR86_000749 [Recurvomyces mirabilis]